MTPGAPTEGARAFHIWLTITVMRSRRRTARELSTHNVDIGNPYSHGYRVQEYSVSRRRVKGSRSSILVGMDTIPPISPLLRQKEPRPRRAYAEEAGELQETAEAVTP